MGAIFIAVAVTAFTSNGPWASWFGEYSVVSPMICVVFGSFWGRRAHRADAKSKVVEPN